MKIVSVFVRADIAHACVAAATVFNAFDVWVDVFIVKEAS